MIAAERLILRPMENRDCAPFSAMCADREVMRYLGRQPTDEEIAGYPVASQTYAAKHGYCAWALERREDGRFLGFCGLEETPEDTPVAGEIEILWRLPSDVWGQGYAREAAQANLAWAWANLAVPRVVAMTTPVNARSWGLMERLGMVRDPALDFDHPSFAEEHPLRAHIVYVGRRA